MDVVALTAFLAPFLPFLLKAGEKATEGAAEKCGVDAWERAKALWAKLRPKVEAKPAAKEAVQDVADKPDDEDSIVALRVQLKKLLEQDKSLAEELVPLMQQPPQSMASGDDIQQQITGNRNKTIGKVHGDVTM
jgi:hypothetical protein